MKIMTMTLFPVTVIPLLASCVTGAQVLLIVTEGLTESLLSHVPTPAVDALASQAGINIFK